MCKIRIIHTNDIHSSFDKFIKMAKVIKELKNENSLLLDAGDFNDFSSLITFGSQGHAGLELLNYLGFSALTIGNNEGFQNISIIEDNSSLGLINFLSCNIFKKNMQSLKNVLPSIIKNVNGRSFSLVIPLLIKSTNEIKIIMYKTVHTGAKSQSGGFKKGLFKL